MLAGQSTLDALVTSVLIKSMNEKQSLDISDFRSKYITFMTTPGSHNDTYAGTCHRMFFKNMVSGRKPEDCPDNDGHNVDAIDALMIVPPVALASLDSTSEELRDRLTKAIHVTRRSSVVLSYAMIFAEMLISVTKGKYLIKYNNMF